MKALRELATIRRSVPTRFGSSAFSAGEMNCQTEAMTKATT